LQSGTEPQVEKNASDKKEKSKKKKKKKHHKDSDETKKDKKGAEGKVEDKSEEKAKEQEIPKDNETENIAPSPQEIDGNQEKKNEIDSEHKEEKEVPQNSSVPDSSIEPNVNNNVDEIEIHKDEEDENPDGNFSGVLSPPLSSTEAIATHGIKQSKHSSGRKKKHSRKYSEPTESSRNLDLTEDARQHRKTQSQGDGDANSLTALSLDEDEDVVPVVSPPMDQPIAGGGPISDSEIFLKYRYYILQLFLKQA